MSGATYSGGASYHDIAATSGGAGAASAASGSAGTTGSGSESSSSGSSSSFIELVDLHGYQLVVPLSESEISNVHVGQIATVTVEALEGRKFAAHVVSLPVLSTSSSGVVSYDVTFQLDQAEPALKPGMSATAEVVVKQAEGVNVPTSAISADSVTVDAQRQAGAPARRDGTRRQQLDDRPQRPEGGRRDRPAGRAPPRRARAASHPGWAAASAVAGSAAAWAAPWAAAAAARFFRGGG